MVKTLAMIELAGAIQVRSPSKSDSTKELVVAVKGRGTVVEPKTPTVCAWFR